MCVPDRVFLDGRQDKILKTGYSVLLKKNMARLILWNWSASITIRFTSILILNVLYIALLYALTIRIPAINIIKLHSIARQSRLLTNLENAAGSDIGTAHECRCLHSVCPTNGTIIPDETLRTGPFPV